jgi:hypothetical protein
MFGLVIPTWIKVVAVLAAIAGTFGAGYYSGYSNEHAKFEKYKLERKLEISELKQNHATTLLNLKDKTVTEYIDRVQYVKQLETKYVQVASTNVPQQGTMSNGWVSLHDASAKSREPDIELASDPTSSGVTDTSALVTIITNYARCTQDQQQLMSLQKFIRDYNINVDIINAKAKK